MNEITTIKGAVEEIQQIEIYSSGFTKQCLIIKTEGNYPQFISIEFLKDKTDLLTGLKKTDEVSVAYNINGRSWQSPQGETKYFNSIVGWKVDKLTDTTKNEPIKEDNPFAEDSDDNSLPF